MAETVTLRKAAKIRSKMATKMAEIQQEFRSFATTRVSIFSPLPNIHAELNKNESEALATFARLKALGAAYAELRGVVSATNQEAGVSDLLASANYFEAMLALVRQQKAVTKSARRSRRPTYLDPEVLPNDEARPDEQTINARILGQIERAKVASAVLEEMMVFSTYTQSSLDEFERFEKEVENKISAIHDKMEEINNTATLVLNDDVLAVLKAENIYPN